MKKMITQITAGSIAEELGIAVGDYLCEVNETSIKDVFDYKLLINSEYLELLVERDGEQTIYEIEKDIDDDLGLTFETWLMDKPKSCANKCIFCFIDQMPKQMRKTLYFKDDDPRLSFISGNYVTLTNISDDELKRLISHRLSPLNISVHALDGAVRRIMLNNENASSILRQLDTLHSAEIDMNFQIVLCKGMNDGEVLDKTILALSKYIPYAKSLSVVPAGITKFRHGLFPLEPFDAIEASVILNQIKNHQTKFIQKYGTRFVYPSDEFFLTAGMALPNINYYEEFPQLENGVGMMSLFQDDFRQNEEVDCTRLPFNSQGFATIATGTLAYPLINDILTDYNINIIPIVNKFFGETITVSGLITGGDLIEQLNGIDLGDKLFIPSNMLKADEQVFLDNITLSQVEQRLKTDITVINGGAELAKNLKSYK